MKKYFYSQLLVLAIILPYEQAIAADDLVRARTAVNASDMRGAEPMVTKLLSQDPKSAEAHFLMSQVLTNRRDFKGAAIELNEALSLDKAASFVSPRKLARYKRKLKKGAETPVSAVASTSTVASASSRSEPVVLPGIAVVSQGSVAGVDASSINEAQRKKSKSPLAAVGVFASVVLIVGMLGWFRFGKSLLVRGRSKSKKGVQSIPPDPFMLKNRIEVFRATIDADDAARAAELNRISLSLGVLLNKIEKYPGHILSDVDARALVEVGRRLDAMLLPTAPSRQNVRKTERQASGPLSRILLRKDRHPVVHREWTASARAEPSFSASAKNNG